MAIRPYDDPFARRATDPVPYGGRRAMDPFSMMDDLMSDMMMPFGGRRSAPGGVSRMGGPFGEMDDMMDRMMSAGGQGMSLGPGGGSSMMMMSSNGGGGGGFSCQQMVFSSSVGQDGQVHTEQFSSSTVGDRQRGIRETQQAYQNSSTGIDKMSLERQLGDHGRKVVKERSRRSGEERQTDMYRGITEEQAHEFDSRWDREAAPHIPSHHLPSRQMLTAGHGHPAAPTRRALPGNAASPTSFASTDYRRGGYPGERGRSAQAALPPSATVSQPQVYRAGARPSSGYHGRYA